MAELQRRALRLLGQIFDSVEALPDAEVASRGRSAEWLDALAIGLLSDADEAEEVIRDLAAAVRVYVEPVREACGSLLRPDHLGVSRLGRL